MSDASTEAAQYSVDSIFDETGDADQERDSAASKPVQQTRQFAWLPLATLLLMAALGVYLMLMLEQARRNPLVQHFAANAEQLKEMNELTLAQIESQAASLSASELLASPYGYDGRYVVTSGAVSGDESMLVAQNVAMNCFNDNQDYRAYVLDDGLVVVDISGEGPEMPAEGTEMKAYGKVIVARIRDVFALPWIGPDLQREFGNVRGMSDKVVFLIARGVRSQSSPLVGARDIAAHSN